VPGNNKYVHLKQPHVFLRAYVCVCVWVRARARALRRLNWRKQDY